MSCEMISSWRFPLFLAALAAPFVAWVPVAVAPARAEPQTRLSGPFVHDNLTVYLVHGASVPGPAPLTLEEAMEKGVVTVHETGTVAELSIENKGEDAVLVHAGDIVKGGQQDRVLTTTMLLPPRSGLLPLASFCVEHGRWSARGGEDVRRFASAKEMMPSRTAKLAMKSALDRRGPYVTAGIDPEAEAQPAADAETRADTNVAASNRPVQQQVQQASPGHSAQGEVWRNVASIQAALSSNLGADVKSKDSDSSLQLALENERLASARMAYMDALTPAGLAEGDVVGLVFAVNGTINSADIYPSNALFRKLWPKLLKAAATEALSARHTTAAAPVPAAVTTDDAQAFLAAAAAGKEKVHAPAKGHKLRVRDSDKAADYETVGADGVLVHHNILAR